MALERSEKLMIALGFIPGVSTVTGLVNAVACYRNQYKPAKDSIKYYTLRSLETVGDVDELAKSQFMLAEYKKDKRALKKIVISSIFQIIPGINIIAGLLALPAYRSHSKADEAIRSKAEKTTPMPVNYYANGENDVYL